MKATSQLQEVLERNVSAGPTVRFEIKSLQSKTNEQKRPPVELHLSLSHVTIYSEQRLSVDGLHFILHLVSAMEP